MTSPACSRGWPRLLAALLLCLAARVHAEPSEAHPGQTSDWPINNQDPEASAPTPAQRDQNPLEFGYWLQDLAAKASAASRREDHALAAKYYRALIRAVPDRAVGVSHLCTQYEALGDTTRALQSCQAVLQLEGVTLNDYIHYAHLVLTTPGALTKARRSELSELLEHLRSQGAAGSDVLDEIDCELALKTDDLARLRSCVTGLRASAHANPTTIVYQWTLAMKTGQLADARDALAHARATAMNDAAIARMEHETQQLAWRQRLVKVLWSATVVCALAVIALLFQARRQRRLTRASS